MNIMLHGHTTRCILNWDNVCGVGEYNDGIYNTVISTNDGGQTKVVETLEDIAALVGYRVLQDDLVDQYPPRMAVTYGNS